MSDELKMDVVDTKQQQEIIALQNKDKDHDFWIKLLAIGIVAWVMLATSIMMIRMTQFTTQQMQKQEK
jgi:hypothetical protein